MAGFIKGKSAISTARNFLGLKHRLTGKSYHRAIKRRVKAKQGFREFHAARRTIQGYEAIHMMPEGSGEVGERFGCSATDSVHQQAVRSGCLRRSLVDPTSRSLADF